MALNSGGEYFTHFMHKENGHVKVRRLHRLEIQTSNGRVYHITGKELPDYIHTNAGEGYKGNHLGQILISGRSGAVHVPDKAKPWPTWRDIFSVGLGFMAVSLLKFVASLIEACF